MSGDFPFPVFGGDYDIGQGSPHSSIHTNEMEMNEESSVADYDLESDPPMNFGPPHENFLYDTSPGVASSPAGGLLDYQQGNQQFGQGAMFPPLEIQQPTYNLNNHYQFPNLIEPSLWMPLGVAEPTAPMSTAVPANLAAVTSRRDNRCGDDCEGIFEGEHKCIRSKEGHNIQCRAKGCESRLTTRGRFNRHWDTKHRNGAFARQKLSCPVIGCGRVGENGFGRQDNLRQHRRNVHGENIPKERRRCMGAASKSR